MWILVHLGDWFRVFLTEDIVTHHTGKDNVKNIDKPSNQARMHIQYQNSGTRFTQALHQLNLGFDLKKKW